MTARILLIVNLLIAASLVAAASVLTAKGGCLDSCFATDRTKLVAAYTQPDGRSETPPSPAQKGVAR
jgi:hypothetical protein